MTSVESTADHNPAGSTRQAANDQCLQVQGEIWRAVAAADRRGNLSLRDETRRIAKAFPASGYSPQDIKDALVFAAVDIGVAIEIAPAAQPSAPVIDVRALLRGKGRRMRKASRKAAAPALQEVPA